MLTSNTSFSIHLSEIEKEKLYKELDFIYINYLDGNIRRFAKELPDIHFLYIILREEYKKAH